jgi:hypothetical protein
MHTFTKDGPWTEEDLEKLRERLSGMSDEALQRFYDAAWQVCRLERGKPPRAPFVQQLVGAWKELAKRER